MSQPKSSKNKKMKNNNKRTSNKRKSVKTTSPLVHKHAMSACSITNPFCSAARAAVRPDGLSFNTIPFQVKGSIAMTTNTAGHAVTMFVPGGGIFGYAGSVVTAGNVTLNAAWTQLPGSTFLVNNAAEIRIVSFGCIFRSTASAINCSGLLHTFVVTNPTVNLVFPQLQQNNPEDHTCSLAPGIEYSWLSKPLGSASHSFRNLTELTSTMSAFDYTSLGVEIFGGAPAVTVGYVEWFVNVELQLSPGGLTTTGLAGVAPTNKPHNSVALTTQNSLQSSVPSLIKGGIDTVEKIVYDKASSYISSLASEGLSALALLM